MDGKPKSWFQFGISSLLGLTTVAAMVVWLVFYHKAVAKIIVLSVGVAVVQVLLVLAWPAYLWVTREMDRRE